MARSNTIWERLWESTEGPTVTVQIPRALAEDLLAALSAACEMGDADGMLAIDLDGPDMDGDDDGFDLDQADDDDAMDLIMRGDDDDHGDDDSDSDDEPEDDDDDEDNDGDDSPPKKKKDENAYCDPKSDGMRPKTALGERVRRVTPAKRRK